jgi:hypothetical protein
MDARALRALRRFAPILALLWLAALPRPALAATSRVLYRYVPTSAVGEAVVKYRYPVRSIPLRLVLEDGRDPDARGQLGTRTHDDDSLHDLLLSNDLWTPAKEGLERQAGAWGITRSGGAELVLTVRLDTLVVNERNQAVGATYKGRAGFSGVLCDGAGVELWAGTASGDTSRYGKAYSGENASEVASDAMVEGLARLLSDGALQAAWSGQATIASAGPVTAPGAAAAAPSAEPAGDGPISPQALLAELLQLQEGGFGEDTIVAYLRGKTLSAPLQAADLLAWKQAGLSERIVGEAVALPVR